MPEEKIDLWTLIRKRFPSGEFALLPEVRDAAGFSASRSADGIAFGLWPSRGLELNGIEIKSFRNDWLRERANPKKAEAIFKYCDRFWLIADNDKVVSDVAEIPVTWGYMVRKGSRICTVKEAPKLTPEPLSRTFIAAMFKRATEGLILPAQIEDKINEAVQADRDRNKRLVSQLEGEVATLQKKIQDFEQAAGIKIDNGWRADAKKTGEAVKFYLDGGYQGFEKKLTGMKETASQTLKDISTALDNYHRSNGQA